MIRGFGSSSCPYHQGPIAPFPQVQSPSLHLAQGSQGSAGYDEENPIAWHQEMPETLYERLEVVACSAQLYLDEGHPNQYSEREPAGGSELAVA